MMSDEKIVCQAPGSPWPHLRGEYRVLFINFWRIQGSEYTKYTYIKYSLCSIWPDNCDTAKVFCHLSRQLFLSLLIHSWVGEGIVRGQRPYISPTKVSLSKIFNPDRLIEGCCVAELMLSVLAGK